MNQPIVLHFRQSFLEKAQRLLKEPEQLTRLTRAATAYVCQHHNLDSERLEYSRLLEQCLRDLYRQRLDTGLGSNGSSINNNSGTNKPGYSDGVSVDLTSCGGGSNVIKVCGVCEGTGDMS